MATDSWGIHPYHVWMNTGVALMIALVFVFDYAIVSFEGFLYLGVFLATFATYEKGFLRLKGRLLGTTSRSYQQDLLVFVLPFSFGLSYVAGISFGTVAALNGLQLAIMMVFLRIGCFCGGCCYGIETPHGVRYPHRLFRPYDDGCQSFEPGDAPSGPVFPVQLLESAANAVIFVVLSWRLLAGAPVTGVTLVLYLVGYAAYRLVGDFLRAYSVRPNHGPFTEGQVCAAIVLASTAGLAAGGVLPPI